ncbi:MAG: AMP-dependent synthetase [Xanthobacteraceae bacterium]|jgi:phenylacetate-CoA ligase|nr:AMP-dependent synthetase [Xanthobacteraceae bacterium]
MMSFAAGPAPLVAFGGLSLAPDLPGGHTQHYFDANETRPSPEREQELMVRLPNLVRSAKVAKGWAWMLSGFESRAIFSREALASLPVLRRRDLALMQAGKPPFGGLVPEPVAAFKRIFADGGAYAPEGAGYDTWRAARALFAAGIRKGDLVVNCLSYHLTPSGFIVDSGCRALGCPVIPAGPAEFQEELDARIEIIAHLEPVAYAGTAELAVRLIERAEAAGRPLSSLRVAFVPEGATEPAARGVLNARGIAVFEAMTTPELGVIAFETEAHEGFVLNEGLIAEIVKPGTGTPVPAHEQGELVITAFDPHHPLIRLATGLLTSERPGVSPCGRTNVRLSGWQGAAATRG